MFKAQRSENDDAYHLCMPKLWNETIESHRQAVRDAILTTTWKLVADKGPLSVTMTEVAEATGIGRATLYKYFPDVESILQAHHQQHVDAHLEELTRLASRPHRSAEDRLEDVLVAYAQICHHRAKHASPDLSPLFHRHDDVASAQRRLHQVFAGLLDEAVSAGAVRTDVPVSELADYCLHSLGAAATAPDEGAPARLASLVLGSVRRVSR